MYRPGYGCGPETTGLAYWFTGLVINETSQFKQYRVIAEYDIGHRLQNCLPPGRPQHDPGTKKGHPEGRPDGGAEELAGLLPRRADHVADPLPGLLIDRTGHAVFPR